MPTENKRMEPADDYLPLRRQFFALRTLFLLQERRLSELSRRDYSLQEARLMGLEASLESEKAMNDTLTKEVEDTTKREEKLREVLEYTLSVLLTLDVRVGNGSKGGAIADICAVFKELEQTEEKDHVVM